MANRRTPDSQPASRSTPPPPAALSDVKTAKAATPPAKMPSPPATAPAASPTPARAAPTAKSRKRKPAAAKTQAVIAARPAPAVSEDERRGMIALSAYLRAERRGFAPGGETEDWIAAEKEVDALLSNTPGAPQ